MIGFYSKVLIAYDGSELAEKALKVGMKLAVHDKKVELHILHVVKPFFIFDSVFDGDEKVSTLRKKSAEAMMKEIKESLEGMGNPIVVITLEGYPEKKIIEYAEKNHCDLIIMGSRGWAASRNYSLAA